MTFDKPSRRSLMHENWNSVVLGQLLHSPDKFSPPLGNKEIPMTLGSFTHFSRTKSGNVARHGKLPILCGMLECIGIIHEFRSSALEASNFSSSGAYTGYFCSRNQLPNLDFHCALLLCENPLPDIPGSPFPTICSSDIQTQAHHRVFVAECELERESGHTFAPTDGERSIVRMASLPTTDAEPKVLVGP